MRGQSAAWRRGDAGGGVDGRYGARRGGGRGGSIVPSLLRDGRHCDWLWLAGLGRLRNTVEYGEQIREGRAMGEMENIVNLLIDSTNQNGPHT